ncbi:MAG TPA: 1,2-phenylacetyl-CoA epoxidase subunit PaaD [Flexivirga sp.]|uniref:1,2-phenylacetyl-CoA epoxidase subunit PaaD n=1 Tax=Flexivirga sp. TaxID=1962927 RepID=UPI002CD30C8D|nr:1,2-phenylacetyl-CoA epoxidase subunit PaaD [Flexivirga sp.]HWC22091.1 1,2-phenylacetyl-CoA epoxidase subunit PaaD [Flexivirga sp.]
MVETLEATAVERAWRIASEVTDPELPMLTLADLGVLRDVRQDDDGTIVVAITPTYTGCPAMATMRDDLVHRLTDAGFSSVRVRVQLSPPWTTDWITDEGRKALSDNGISPPGQAPRGPISLQLAPTRRAIHCLQCGSGDTEVTSEFGSTACKALYRCRACGEPFDHVKEI